MAKRTNLETVVIRPAVWRVLVNVVLYAAFVFTGFALVATPDPMPRLIGAAVVVYFGILLVYALWRFLKPAPSLAFGAEGVHDNASITGVGGIHWHEITNIEQKKTYLVRHIAISLRDRETVIDRMPVPRRWLVQLTTFSPDATVNISQGFLSMPLDEVESLYHPVRIEDLAGGAEKRITLAEGPVPAERPTDSGRSPPRRRLPSGDGQLRGRGRIVGVGYG